MDITVVVEHLKQARGAVEAVELSAADGSSEQLLANALGHLVGAAAALVARMDAKPLQVQIGTDLWVDPARVMSIHRKCGNGDFGVMVQVNMGTYTASYQPDWPIGDICKALGLEAAGHLPDDGAASVRPDQV